MACSILWSFERKLQIKPGRRVAVVNALSRSAATKLKWPSEISPGAIFMPDGNRFGNIGQSHHLVGHFLIQPPVLPEKECGRLLGSFSVVVSENVRVGL